MGIGSMATFGWARCTDSVADVLRRGAWYPVVDEPAAGQLVVEVRGQRVQLRAADVRVRREPPAHWSIVLRTGVLRPTLGGQGREVVNTYAVCPHCHHREDFSGRPATLTCGGCGATAAVDWSETC
jgi:hypothetical protein